MKRGKRDWKPLTSLEQIGGVGVKKGKAEVGRFYEPISHTDLTRALIEGAGGRWEVGPLRAHAGNGGRDLSLTLDLGIGLFAGITHGWYRPVDLWGGVRFIRTPSIPLFRKRLGRHTTSLAGDLRGRVDEALGKFDAAQPDLLIEVGAWKRTEHTQGRYVRLLDAAEGLLPRSRLGALHKLYRDGEPTDWGMLTAFALMAGKGPPLKYLETVWKFVQALRGES